MFGAKYTRTKFWLTSLPTILLFAVLLGISNNGMQDGDFAAIVGLGGTVLLINFLANRIRAFGSNPWLALLALIPLVGLFQALYYGTKESK